MHLDGDSWNLVNILLFLHRSLISFLYLVILILKITDSGFYFSFFDIICTNFAENDSIGCIMRLVIIEYNKFKVEAREERG